jgi:hypothetical protein
MVASMSAKPPAWLVSSFSGSFVLRSIWRRLMSRYLFQYLIEVRRAFVAAKGAGSAVVVQRGAKFGVALTQPFVCLASRLLALDP